MSRRCINAFTGPNRDGCHGAEVCWDVAPMLAPRLLLRLWPWTSLCKNSLYSTNGKCIRFLLFHTGSLALCQTPPRISKSEQTSALPSTPCATTNLGHGIFEGSGSYRCCSQSAYLCVPADSGDGKGPPARGSVMAWLAPVVGHKVPFPSIGAGNRCHDSSGSRWGNQKFIKKI